MKLTHLEIHHLRNIDQIQFNPVEQFNFIVGENGSGKTSILEAIYLLGLGRSFRTHLIRRYIQNQQEKVAIYSRLETEHQTFLPLGLEKSLKGESFHRFNSQNIDNLYQLAIQLPLFLIYTESFYLLTGGPKERRQFFDFGMFHVKPFFIKLWREYATLLKQRNAALRSQITLNQVSAWDSVMVERGLQLHQLRKEFIEEFQEYLVPYIEKFLPFKNIEINFDSGWDLTIPLDELLKQNLLKDKELGYTSKGPHRFDFKIKIAGMPASDILSRGQMKLLVCALYFAMENLMFLKTQKKGIFLVDDLPSEFDQLNFNKIMNTLEQSQCQIFITSTDELLFQNYLSSFHHKMFHVKHGTLMVEKQV